MDNKKKNSLETQETETEDHAADNLPDSNKGIITEILKQFRPGMEIKHLTLPPFIIEPRSLLDKLADFYTYQSLMKDINPEVEGIERMLQIVKLYLSGWNIRPKGVKNPFNPVIGEVFSCEWETDGMKSYYIAEQISHHPPHSAFCFYNPSLNISCRGNVKPAYVKFYGNWVVSPIGGNAVLTINDEEYEMTFPSYSVKGLVIGKLVLEITGKTSIKCKQTGYSCDFDFKSKGLFKGKYNEISGKLKVGSKKKNPLFSFSGSWDDVIYITDLSKKAEPRIFLDINGMKNTSKKHVVGDYLPQSSSKVWTEVCNGINGNDDESALQGKLKIEQKQREEAKIREKNSTPFFPVYFTRNGDSDDFVYKYLQQKMGSGESPFDSIDPSQ